MRIFFIGDVVGESGCATVAKLLPAFKRERGIELTIANAENAANQNGTTRHAAEALLSCGVDVLTGGNHTMRHREIYEWLDERPDMLRPANYPPGAPGQGLLRFDMGRVSVTVINLLGVTFMDALDNPFTVVDRLLAQVQDKIVFVDFHAEATSEKRALALYLDGRVSAVVGTHTHVQTADEMILPLGTACLTDAGMTGPVHSVIGMAPAPAIERFRSRMPMRFSVAEGACTLCGVIVDIDPETGRATAIERVALNSANG